MKRSIIDTLVEKLQKNIASDNFLTHACQQNNIVALILLLGGILQNIAIIGILHVLRAILWCKYGIVACSEFCYKLFTNKV